MNRQPKEIQKRGDRELWIRWEDGHESLYPFRLLRQKCPCASCVDEWTGRPTLDPGTIQASIQAEKAELVGNYAVAFQFSDGHSTGIFSFDNLRKLCPCPNCAHPAQAPDKRGVPAKPSC